MNVVKCVNGHFFDSDSYQLCPHCGGALSDGGMESTVQEKPKKKGLFSGWKKSSEKADTSAQIHETVRESSEKTVQKTENPEPVFEYGDKTEVLPVQNLPYPENQNSIPDHPSPDSPVTREAAEDRTSALWQGKTEEKQSSSLTDAIRKVSASSEGKTASYFNAVTSVRNNDSGSASSEATVIPDPVTGWLVCIEGPHFGESFCISAGKNSVGRNDSNRIILSRDSAVSREKHAFIIYEPKKRNFYIQPGESSGLTYLNDDYITESKILSEKDVIETGGSKFIFIPLCGEKFTWEDYIKKEQ